MLKYSIFALLLCSATYALPKSPVVVQNTQSLFTAVQQNNVRAVSKLVSTKKIDLNELNKNNQTVLDVAIKYGNKKIIRTLAGKGARVTTEKNANYLCRLFTQRAFNFFLAGWVFTPLLWIGSAVSFNKSVQDFLL